VDGHGSIVYLLFALPLAVAGAVASVLSVKLTVLRTANPWLRLAVVALLASAPALVLATFGVVMKPSYSASDALAFVAMLTVPTIVVAAIAELIAHGTWPKRENAA